MISLPLSSHLATSASSLLFSWWNISTCSAIFAFSSCGSCAMMACVGYRKSVTNGDKEAQTGGWLCLQLMAKPDPDKDDRLPHHSGKYFFSSPKNAKAQTGKVPTFPVPVPTYKKNKRSKGTCTLTVTELLCRYDDICLFKRIYSWRFLYLVLGNFYQMKECTSFNTEICSEKRKQASVAGKEKNFKGYLSIPSGVGRCPVSVNEAIHG